MREQESLRQSYMRVERENGQLRILLNLAKGRAKKMQQRIRLLQQGYQRKWVSIHEYGLIYCVSRTTIWTLAKHGKLTVRRVPIHLGSHRPLVRILNVPPL